MKRELAGRHLVQHHTAGEQISPSVQLFPARLFRRHVSHCTQHRARAGQVLCGRSGRRELRSPDFCAFLFSPFYLGQAKVQNLCFSTIRHENVRGLDVPMNDPFEMCGIQRIRNLCPKLQQLLDRQRFSAQPMFQRLAFHQFHGNEGLAVAFVNIVNRADVWMVQSRCSTRFSFEPLQGLAVLCQFLGQELQGHEAAQLDVLGLIHHTHAATTELLQDAVVGNGFANHHSVTWLTSFGSGRQSARLKSSN